MRTPPDIKMIHKEMILPPGDIRRKGTLPHFKSRRIFVDARIITHQQ